MLEELQHYIDEKVRPLSRKSVERFAADLKFRLKVMERLVLACGAHGSPAAKTGGSHHRFTRCRDTCSWQGRSAARESMLSQVAAVLKKERGPCLSLRER